MNSTAIVSVMHGLRHSQNNRPGTAETCLLTFTLFQIPSWGSRGLCRFAPVWCSALAHR